MSTPPVTEIGPPSGSRGGRFRRVSRHWWFWLASGVVVAIAAVAVYVWSVVHPLVSAKYQNIAYTVPSAPHLSPQPGSTIYRIDPTHSELGYSVREKFLGHSTSTAVGRTNGIAGDLALDHANPSASRIGEIVANVEELHSDNNLRDAKIRAEYLQSHDYPLVTMTDATLRGMPASIVDGQTYHFTMQGRLLVKQRPGQVVWDVTASTSNGKLTAVATAHTKMSRFGVGPISVAGLVSTSDDVTLTLHLTAVDPTKFSVPTTIPTPTEKAKQAHGPSFKNTVMPLLQANCASCHKPGEVGAVHWSLATAGDAAAVSDGIGTVVNDGYMPPWPASDKGIALAHSKKLSRKQVKEIVDWAKAGGQLDVAASTRIKPTQGPAGTPPRNDVVMKMPQAYTGSLSNPNDYRCFVLDPHITAPTYITGYQVTPGHRTEIHHVQIFHINAAQAAAGNQRSGSDGQPGWSCYTGPLLPGGDRGPSTSVTPRTGNDKGRRRGGFDLSRLVGQPGLIAGWVPGQDPVVYPENSGILFQPGDAVVLQIHYHYAQPPVPDQSTVSLQTDPGTKNLKQLEIVNPIGPVEIPCDPGATAPLCNRSAALADDARLYGPAGSFIEPGLLLLCNRTAEQLAATYHDGVASSSCDSKVPESGQIVGVLGHMHTLGKSFRLTLNPGAPDQQVLLDIPNWNFDWQMNYELQKPLHVTAGQTVRMECSWDRSLDPNRPQKYIVFAEGTEDEMCFSTYALIPDNQNQG
jgi:polyisoprenoid-binding protein YceI/mono/diheme cytochrome c family protein